MPNVPSGTGVFMGVNNRANTPARQARAAMEGVTMGMNYGLNRLISLGLQPTQIRATGGGRRQRQAGDKSWPTSSIPKSRRLPLVKAPPTEPLSSPVVLATWPGKTAISSQ